MFNHERMAELIREKEIEQKALAESIGVSEAAVSYYARGLKSPSIEILSRIAKALGVSAAELIKE